MLKIIIYFVCLIVILSACEKISLNNPSGKLIKVTTHSDTTKVVPPAVTPPVTPSLLTTLSFSADIIPLLTQCENCHNHGWTQSSVASTYYTNLINKGYVKPSSYTSSSIYAMIASGHPRSSSMPTVNTDKIITWMKEGSLNN